MTTTLSSKGQVVIPKKIRQRLGIPTGAKLDCGMQDGKIILTLVDERPCARIVMEKGYPVLEAPKGAPAMTTELIKELLAEE